MAAEAAGVGDAAGLIDSAAALGAADGADPVALGWTGAGDAWDGWDPAFAQAPTRTAMASQETRRTIGYMVSLRVMDCPRC